MTPEVMAWLNAWAVFPSSGHMPIVRRIRQALAESRSLDETPPMCFPPDELEDALSFLVASTLFFWDCLLVGGQSQRGIFVSHDEYFALASQDSAFLTSARSDLLSVGWLAE